MSLEENVQEERSTDFCNDRSDACELFGRVHHEVSRSSIPGLSLSSGTGRQLSRCGDVADLASRCFKMLQDASSLISFLFSIFLLVGTRCCGWSGLGPGLRKSFGALQRSRQGERG